MFLLACGHMSICFVIKHDGFPVNFIVCLSMVDWAHDSFALLVFVTEIRLFKRQQVSASNLNYFQLLFTCSSKLILPNNNQLILVWCPIHKESSPLKKGVVDHGRRRDRGGTRVHYSLIIIIQLTRGSLLMGSVKRVK